MSEFNAPQPDVTLLLDMEGVIREVTLSPSMSTENIDAWLGHPWSEFVAGAAEKMANEEAEKKRIEEEARNTAFDLLFVQGLYASAPTNTPVGEIIEEKVRYGAFAFDSYCVACKRETTFRVAAREVPGRGANPRYPAQTAVPPTSGRCMPPASETSQFTRTSYNSNLRS